MTWDWFDMLIGGLLGMAVTRIMQTRVIKKAHAGAGWYVVDLNTSDAYDEGYPPKPEPIGYYTFGPFDSYEAAQDWGNRNLQFFGVGDQWMWPDPRDWDDHEDA